MLHVILTNGELYVLDKDIRMQLSYNVFSSNLYVV